MSTTNSAMLAFGSARDKVSQLRQATMVKINEWRFSQAQSKLERQIARIIETAKGHEAKGVESGDKVYVALRQQLDKKLTAFCERWNYDRDLIIAQAPAIKDLYELAIPKRGMSPGAKLLALILGGGLALALIGAASGIIQLGHDKVIQGAQHVHLLH